MMYPAISFSQSTTALVVAAPASIPIDIIPASPEKHPLVSLSAQCQPRCSLFL
jgi:hypothetical protein